MAYIPGTEANCLYYHESSDIGPILKGRCSYEPGENMACYGRCRAYKNRKELCNAFAAETRYADFRRLWAIWQAFLCSQHPNWRQPPAEAHEGQADPD